VETPRAPFWNIWWTLTVISGALTIIAALLEALGVFRDIGVFLSITGAILTVIFGLSASTRSSVLGFRREVLPRLDRMDTGLGEVTARLGEVTARLGEVTARLGEVTARLGGVDGRLTQVTERLERIVTILDERLPRPTP
jgi:hypothetical protein